MSKLTYANLQVVTWISQDLYIHFSKLLHGIVKVFIWICQNCHMDLSKLFRVFLALCQINPAWSLTKSSKLVMFCSDLNELFESKYSMSWVRCASGNVSFISWWEVRKAVMERAFAHCKAKRSKRRCKAESWLHKFNLAFDKSSPGKQK